MARGRSGFDPRMWDKYKCCGATNCGATNCGATGSRDEAQSMTNKAVWKKTTNGYNDGRGYTIERPARRGGHWRVLRLDENVPRILREYCDTLREAKEYVDEHHEYQIWRKQAGCVTFASKAIPKNSHGICDDFSKGCRRHTRYIVQSFQQDGTVVAEAAHCGRRDCALWAFENCIMDTFGHHRLLHPVSLGWDGPILQQRLLEACDPEEIK